jgi:hypothetical protein
VNPEHLHLLRRRAASEPVDSAGLQLKVAALGELVRGLHVEESPDLIASFRIELIAALAIADQIATARATAASTTAARLLSELDERVQATQPPPAPVWGPFGDVDCLYLMGRMADAAGKQFSERRLWRDCKAILSAGDDEAKALAFQQWRLKHDIPESLPVSSERVALPDELDDESQRSGGPGGGVHAAGTSSGSR